MKKSIVVVGSANLDLVCNASRIPAPGETIWGDRFQTFHGGKGANQAVAAAKLGARVAMVAKVGPDDFGSSLKLGLESVGVDVTHINVAPATASGVALISVDAHGQNSILVIPGANGELSPADLDRALPLLESAGIILAQLEVPMETVEHLGRIAVKAGIPFMLDPAPARPIAASLLRCVTYLTPNETEAATLCGMSSEFMTREMAADAAEKLLHAGVRNVLLKMGGRGVLIATAEGVVKFLSAYHVTAVDTTAAGDACNAGIAVALMRGADLETAVRYGMAVAAVSVTRSGAQSSMPNEAEVQALLTGTHPEAESQITPVEICRAD